VGFFATFWGWLNGQLTNYISSNTALVATTLEPAVVTLGTVYVMAWGYLQLTGQIEEPFLTGLKRIFTLALVLGVAIGLWLYNDILVDTFYKAPAEFAAAIVGANDPVQTIDAVWDQGGAAADRLFHQGANFWQDIGYSIMGAITWVIVGFLCVYTMFLIALANIALAVLLAVGPLFVVMLLFERTRRLFDSWLAQLTNYALVTVLTIMITSLLLSVMSSFATQTAALGPAMTTADCLDMLLVAGLVLLILRQVLPLAAGLAGGIALNSYGTVSRIVGAPIGLAKEYLIEKGKK
jgi:type IV secretion system protein VirB6